MSEVIGDTAGKVWQFLQSNGAATSNQIQKGIKADTALTNQAIGWLAREHKLAIDHKKRYAKYSLTQ